MAKIQCMAHGRRVHVLDGGAVVHRSEGVACHFPLLLGERVYQDYGEIVSRQPSILQAEALALYDLMLINEARASLAIDKDPRYQTVVVGGPE